MQVFERMKLRLSLNAQVSVIRNNDVEIGSERSIGPE